MSSSLKKQMIIGLGVVVGTAVFKKFISPTLNSVLPNKA